ncbi:MAG TPA: N(4)-(beta-N-acetylglucosaminyl)-L-asparaginase [Phycisphaerae bacterium]|jgi:N4-(beta-N-acetylglucosaminyl)-L-asparaginase
MEFDSALNSGVSRRDFLQSAAALAVMGGMESVSAQPAQQRPAALAGKPPVVIASANGLTATQKAMDLLLAGGDPLDAVVAGVNIIELDPNDNSVGYGGLPNEEGVVELDASVMHGPTHKAGAVAALRNIKTPSSVAKMVMQRTRHVLLVGEGALRFAKAHGFKEEDLLTDASREAWLKWKETMSDKDDWLPPLDEATSKPQSRRDMQVPWTNGTINCLALSAKGDLAGVTTTSGLSYKIPGRVGDSPIIGAGLYVDNEIGAAGSTGRGESCIQNSGAFAIVERMRSGASPAEACLDIIKRVVAHTHEKWLLRDDGRPNFDLKFYALAKDGRFGAASLWSGAEFAVFADGQNRREKAVYLFEKS